MLEIAFAALLLAEESVPVRIEGLTESNLAAFAERVKAIKSKRSSEAKEAEPVVKDVRLKEGKAILVLQEKMELRLGALEKALEKTEFKIDRTSIVYGTSFNIVVSGMG